ncbi:MAG: bifunctional metallophosphatase/5'-nucleotidase [Geodermatophilaceae bacterium]|nr:bifunctional metallophosphatase/5'-nucleotidase [Geodermatophilaceae bacterium]
MSRRIPLTLAAVTGLLIAVPLIPATAAPGDIDVQLLAVNDFHGRIEVQSGGDGELITDPGPDGEYGTDDDVSELVGGAANLATTLDQQAADFGSANSFFVGAGDLISASTFTSSVFLDEPTIEVLNALGMDYSSVGNHEFDRGTDELLRIDGGGCVGEQNVDSCFTDSTGDTRFDGADFPYLAANVVYNDAGVNPGEPILPAYELLDVGDGQRLALIGVVTRTTPTIVSPTGVETVDFLDEAETINSYAAELTDPGFPGGPVNAIAVLIHEGGTAAGADAPDFNACDDLAGPIVDINDGLATDDVDLIVSAHTHEAYNCRLPRTGEDPARGTRLVTQGGFYGKLVTDIRLQISPTTGEIDPETMVALNVPVLQGPGDPDIAAIVQYWTDRAAEQGQVSVGSQTEDIDRAYQSGSPVRDSESSLGSLIADVQLASVQDEAFNDPVIAFMNPGGIRADLNCLSSGPDDPDGNITYSEVFTVQPFGNTVNTLRMTGADLHQLLEEQFPNNPNTPPDDEVRTSLLLLSVSDGFRYEFDPNAAWGEAVDPASITLNGEVVDPAGEYVVAVNSFLAGGGDSFYAFTAGTDPVTGPVDVDAFVDYLGANSPVSPPPLDRSVSLDPDRPLDDDGSGMGPCSPATPTPTPTPSPTPTPTSPPPPSGPPPTGPPPTPPPGGGLPVTGAPVMPLALLGGALVLAGAAAVFGVRRRQH